MKPTRYFFVMASLVALVVLPKLGCITIVGGGSARFKETRSVTAPAADAIVVRTQNGAISIRRGESPDTAVVANIVAQTQERLAGAKIVADRQSDGSLLVAVEWPGGRAMSNEGCSFEIAVPTSVGVVTATTSNGMIQLASLTGPARLETSNGRITVTDHAGHVVAATSNGAVYLTNVAGDAEAYTSNGAVEMRGVTGRATAHTSNGRVTLALADNAPGPIDVQTSNGAVDVTLPKTYSGRLTLSTSNGSLRYSTTAAVHDLNAGRTHASFAVGDSLVESTVETSNGSIDLRFAP